MSQERQVVWILGAGFSAPLGGPLLTRLLSRASEREIEVRYPQSEFPALYGDLVTDLRRLYEFGSTDEVLFGRTGRGTLLWRHAEEFLDYVDTAAEPRPEGVANPRGAQLARIVKQDLTGRHVQMAALRDCARRLMAAECCAFLEDADLSSEQWRPFRQWALSLRPNDTIISFNYDRVVEKLRDAQNEDFKRSVGPQSPILSLTPGAIDRHTLKERTPFLKLHGSVDWRREETDGRTTVTVSDERHALRCPPTELAMATPGPSKMRTAGGFGDLWELAKERLQVADAVIFVGYRFPETDADAREQLLGALGENGAGRQSPQQLQLHSVLGNFAGDRAPERLAALLRFACRRVRDEAARTYGGSSDPQFAVTTHPLLAQDFFTVARREDLL